MKAIEEARRSASFLNHTNNLRSSLGIAVSLNGAILKSDFKLVGDGTLGDGGQGLRKAQDLIDHRSGEYPNQLLLVLVAAEEYAIYVESKGRDVLTFVSGGLEKSIKKIL